MSAAGFAFTVLRRRTFSALVQVTNRCNMKCPFCDFWPNGDLAGELTVAEHARVASECAREGTMLVSIEGGEPLVRPDLPEIVAAWASVGHLPLLYTNGWFVDEARVAALSRTGIHQVGVSIDFCDAESHDRMRRTPGAFVRATAAVERLRDALGPSRVHLMTVLMRENEGELSRLLELSAVLGVRHQVTLLSDLGFRRSRIDDATRPAAGLGSTLRELSARYPHLSTFRSYLEGIPAYLDGAPLPRCGAGLQSFNLDHAGNVSPCIEKIDASVGNVRTAGVAELLQRLRAADAGKGCQACWTLCRGTAQALGNGGAMRDWVDLARM